MARVRGRPIGCSRIRGSGSRTARGNGNAVSRSDVNNAAPVRNNWISASRKLHLAHLTAFQAHHGVSKPRGRSVRTLRTRGGRGTGTFRGRGRGRTTSIRLTKKTSYETRGQFGTPQIGGSKKIGRPIGSRGRHGTKYANGCSGPLFQPHYMNVSDDEENNVAQTSGCNDTIVDPESPKIQVHEMNSSDDDESEGEKVYRKMKETGTHLSDERSRVKADAEAQLKALEDGTHPRLIELDESYKQELAGIRCWASMEETYIMETSAKKVRQLESNFDRDRKALQNKLCEETQQELTRLKRCKRSILKKANINDWETDYLELDVPEKRNLRSNDYYDDDSNDSLIQIEVSDDGKLLPDRRRPVKLVEVPSNLLKFSRDEIKKSRIEIKGLKCNKRRTEDKDTADYSFTTQTLRKIILEN